MKKLMVVLLVLIIFSPDAHSQNPQKEFHPKLKISNFSSSIGNLSIYHQNASFDELKETTMNSDAFYSDNIEGYQKNAFNESDISSFNLSIGLTPYSNKLNGYRDNHEIQIGFTLNSGYRRYFSFLKEESSTLDSMYFHGSVLKADSIKNSSIYYDEYVNDISLSLAYLFKTNSTKKFGAYAGLSADIGFAFLSEVEKQKHSSSYVSISIDDIYTNSDFNGNSNSSENFVENTDNSIFIRTAIPVGLTYRLSKKDNFLSLIQIFTQGKFGFEYQSVAKYTYLNALLGINGGLKFNIG